MDYVIVTGASRGLGEALTEALIHPETALFCIARHENFRLVSLAEKRGCRLTWYCRDLADTGSLEPLMAEILAGLSPRTGDAVYLINNAGVVEPVKTATRSRPDEVAFNLSVNAAAPMILSGLFVRMSGDWPCRKRILMISSGAGQKPYHGWSAYCSAKAAVDMFTRCLGLEQETAPNPVRIVSLAPGIVDTAMQAKIRQADETDFPQVSRFTAFKRDGQLSDPALTAARIVRFLKGDRFPGGAVLDLRLEEGG